jgi:hypothetical protein
MTRKVTTRNKTRSGVTFYQPTNTKFYSISKLRPASPQLRNTVLQSKLPIQSTILSAKLQQNHTDSYSTSTQGKNKGSQGQLPPWSTNLTPPDIMKQFGASPFVAGRDWPFIHIGQWKPTCLVLQIQEYWVRMPTYPVLWLLDKENLCLNCYAAPGLPPTSHE